MLMTRSVLNLDAPKADFTYWNNITDSPVSDFIMSADVTWNSPKTGNECGLLYRYNEPADTPDQRTFYAVTITRDGSFRVAARDQDGYRSSFIIDQAEFLDQRRRRRDKQHDVGRRWQRIPALHQRRTGWRLSGPSFDSGSVGIFASRGSGTQDAVCNFRNVWAYSLEGASLPAVTPSEGAVTETETPVASNGGLMSDNADDVLAALVQMGVVNGTPKLVVQDPYNEMVVAENETSMSRFGNALSTTNYTNFIITTDIVSNGDEKATDVQCGVYYDGSNVPDNLVAVYYDRDKNYALSVRKDTQWGDAAVTYGQSDSINPGITVANRFTMIVIDGDVHLYINGNEMFEVSDFDLHQWTSRLLH